MNRKISAFTLIEILVSLTIIGVLLTFVAPYVFDRPDQARKLKIDNDFMAITTAYQLYKLDNGSLPTATAGLDALGTDTAKGQTYIKSVPLDPWGTPYRAVAPASGGIVIVSAGTDKIFDDAQGGDDIVSEPIQ